MHAFFFWLNKSISFLFLGRLWYWHDIIATCRLMHSTDWRMKALELLTKRENAVVVVVVAFSVFICIVRPSLSLVSLFRQQQIVRCSRMQQFLILPLKSRKDSIKSNVCCAAVMYLYGRVRRDSISRVCTKRYSIENRIYQRNEKTQSIHVSINSRLYAFTLRLYHSLGLSWSLFSDCSRERRRCRRHRHCCDHFVYGQTCKMFGALNWLAECIIQSI